MKKKIAVVLLGALAFCIGFAGCKDNKATEAANESAETEEEGNGKDAETQKAQETGEKSDTETVQETVMQTVGVLLPKEDDRWKLDAATMTQSLLEAGYAAQISYAEGDVSRQVSQIQELVDSDVAALIIDPVDAYALPDVLEKAKEKSIPVFSYEDLIMDTDAVNYYTVFNSREIGQMLGNAIVDEYDLSNEENTAQSYTIEFLMGSPDDNTALFLYNGVMEVLQPYLDNGSLVCKSQKTSFDDTGVMRWSQNTAKMQMSALINDFYEGAAPDIICTAYDNMAEGVIEALNEAEIMSNSENWPFITGVGSEAEAVKRVAEGVQAMTVFMDNRTLAKECVDMVTAYLKGDKPEVKDYEQYDNGKKIIGTFTCDVQLIDADNYQLLIDNGYYTADQVEPEIQTVNTPAPSVTEAPEEALTVTPNPEADLTTTPEADETLSPTPEEKETLTGTPEPTAEGKTTPTPTGKTL